MKAITQRLLTSYRAVCQSTYAFVLGNTNAILAVVGTCALLGGVVDFSSAQLANAPGSAVGIGDRRIYLVSVKLFELIEGNLGSLIMIAAGLGAIIASAFGAYRAAVGLLVVAVGAFILRSLVVIFFDFK